MVSLALGLAMLLAPARHAPQLPAISQNGLTLSADGHPVTLRGVNLGGWFVEELWMTPWIDRPAGAAKAEIPDAATLWRVIAKNLGAEAMLQVRKAWRENWITPDDFARIKKLGFNAVRIPFRDELLDEEGGLEWLHKAVDYAAKAGLYSILDMHGAPGGQSTDQPTGEVGRNRLWFDVENIAKAEKDWSMLGKEFGNNPNVAMFDLMNEPMGAPNEAMLFLVYDRLVRAVRKTAPHKVVLIDDGYRGFKVTPHPNLAGWTDVCFSLHFYDWDAKSQEDHWKAINGRLPELKQLLGYRQAPLFVGEWNCEPNGGPRAIRGVVDILDKAGFSWAFWTYKVLPAKGGLGDWGIFHLYDKVTALDPYNDSKEDLLRKMPTVRTKNLGLSDGMEKSFTPGQ